MDTSSRIIVILILLVLVVWGGYLLFTAPEPADTAPTATSTPVATEPIKIGVSGPLTGEAASYGEGMLAGATLAIKEINDAGGVNGRPLEMVAEDDKCSRDGATTFNKLVNVDKVAVIIGPICSAAAGPGLPVAQAGGVPTIFWGSAPDLPKIGDYVFRTYPSDSFQGKYAAEFIFTTLGKKKAAVLFVKNDWGQGIRNVFVERFKELGGTVVFDEGLSQDAKDARTLVTKVKAAKPDVVYIPMYPAIGVITLKQMKDIGLQVAVVGGDAFDTKEVTEVPQAAGVLFTIAKLNNPEEFKARVKEGTGKDSNLVTPLAYDGIKIFAMLMKQVGVDQKAIREALATLSYRDAVALPLIEFNQDGDLKSAEFEVRSIKNGVSEPYQQ